MSSSFLFVGLNYGKDIMYERVCQREKAVSQVGGVWYNDCTECNPSRWIGFPLRFDKWRGEEVR